MNQARTTFFIRQARRALNQTWRLACKLLDTGLLLRLWLSRKQTGRRARVLFVVHGYFPRIGGSEVHCQYMAEALSRQGYDVLIYTLRNWKDPRRVNGIPVVSLRQVAGLCDVVFTYSQNSFQRKLGAYLTRLQHRPKWLHHPCARDLGTEMILHADRVFALNPRDEELTVLTVGSDQKVIRANCGLPANRVGRQGVFRQKYRLDADYIVWVGAWLKAKGCRNLSERFIALRHKFPEKPVKLVMFGGYGNEERPIPHPDIVIIDGNTEDVPDALAGCLFLAFNSPPHPVGFDANPLFLVEGFMNGKTFLAQKGTPVLTEMSDLGVIVGTDSEWIEAAGMLISCPEKRAQLESACVQAYEHRYHFKQMMDRFESAVGELLAEERPGTP